jgi:hypothetical protein
MSESEGGFSGAARISPGGWDKSDAGTPGGDVAVDAGGIGDEDTGGTVGTRGFRKANGLGKSKGRVNRALGFAPGRFGSSTGVFAVTSGVTAAAGVTAIAGASGTKLVVPLAKSGPENAALPCPGKTEGVVG